MRTALVSIALMVPAAGCSPAGDAGSVTDMTDMTGAAIAIRGATALVGPDLTPVPDSTVLIEDAVIRAVGRGSDVAVPDAARVIDGTGITVIPGFIDAHVHIAFFPPADVVAGGVTTVRDLAWPPSEIFPLAERSFGAGFDGPRILAAGPMITAPGGYPTKAAWAAPGTGAPVASVEEARAAVAGVSERGGAIVKIALNPPVGPTLAPELVRAIVAAAHEQELRVTGHIYGLEELDKAIDAGVDELAHMLMSPERIPDDTLDAMVAADMTVVPTLSIFSGAGRDIAVENLRRFLDAGGRVVYGTDLGNEGPRPGIDPTEVGAMAAAGMSPKDIIASATVVSADWLGLYDTGVLEEGMRADMVGLRGDPTEDVGALTDVAFVVAGGRVVRP